MTPKSDFRMPRSLLVLKENANERELTPIKIIVLTAILSEAKVRFGTSLRRIQDDKRA